MLYCIKVEFGLDWIIKFAIRKNKKVWLSGYFYLAKKNSFKHKLMGLYQFFPFI